MGKKQKIKREGSFVLLKDKGNRTLISILISLSLTLGVVFAATGIELLISQQSSTNQGSNDSTISFSTGGITKFTHYVNDGNNSTIIGNYLKGYYYDSVFGYFRLNWSPDKKKNVRIVGTTSKCGTGVGYKLGGKAKGIYGGPEYPSAGYIDFDYNSSTFVYYCEKDKRLHGRGYSRWVGYQDFEGIGFEILSDGTSTTTFTGASDIFLNDDTDVDMIQIFTGSNSNVGFDKILGERYNFDATDESIFYIIK